MKHLLSLFIIFLLFSCARNSEIHYMFKWKPTSTVADSLTVHLERGFINTFPDSVFISMLDSLKDETARHDNFKHRSKQIKARYHYWLAIYESRHMNWSLARSHIKKSYRALRLVNLCL